MRRGANIIGFRWVQTNKGTDADPKIRSRCVCQELGYGSQTIEEMFAPTPPLVAMNWGTGWSESCDSTSSARSSTERANARSTSSSRRTTRGRKEDGTWDRL